MLRPGQWVEVALPKGARRAQLIELEGARSCCVFDDGQKAWVATSLVSPLTGSGASSAPPAAPASQAPHETRTSSTPAASSRWLAALLSTAVVLAIGTASFAAWRRAAASTIAVRISKLAPMLSPMLAKSRPPVSGISLPFVTRGLALRKSDECVNVVIDGTGIYVETDRVAGVEPYRDAKGLRRIDELFHRLKATKDAWKAAHVAQDFLGVVQLWVHDETSAQVMKDAFQTAAFAGYPNASFVLRRRDNPLQLERLNVDAQVPAPPTAQRAAPAKRLFRVVLRSNDQVELLWLGPQLERPQERTVPLSALRETVQAMWSEKPAGIILDAWHQEEAYLYVPDDATFRKVALVLDGLSAALAHNGSEEYPAFNVTLKVDHGLDEIERWLGQAEGNRSQLAIEDPRYNGRVDPTVVQKIVRSSFDHLRKCYENTLAKSPTLSGRLVLRFVIMRDGSVSHAEVAPESMVRDEDLERCVLAKISRLKFPRPQDGIVTVVYPLALEPA